MVKHVIVLFLFITISISGYAQQDTVSNVPVNKREEVHLRMSLVTGGMGDEIWQTFGHTAFRIIDSTRNDAKRDQIYNYGEFDISGSFFWAFVSGKLNVYLGILPFNEFAEEYVEDHRGIEEQVLLLSNEQKRMLFNFLDSNAEPGNNYYEYHIFFDNCCTRARNVFPSVFGSDFIIGDPLPKDFHLSYRTAFNLYYRNRYWERVGINICMGSSTDTTIENRTITFLPEFFSIAMDGATLNGQKITAPSTTLFEDHINHADGINQPVIVSILIAILTIIGLSFPRYRTLGKVMRLVVLGISVFLSVCVLFHWFYSEHVYGGSNYNILWTLPTNLFFAFFNFKGKHIYAIVAMMFILLSIVVHILRLQVMPLFEIWPYLLALLCVYGYAYRNNKSYNGPVKFSID